MIEEDISTENEGPDTDHINSENSSDVFLVQLQKVTSLPQGDMSTKNTVSIKNSHNIYGKLCNIPFQIRYKYNDQKVTDRKMEIPLKQSP